jgi:hypothetical protein
MLGTVDLVEKDTDTLVFSTWDEEKSTVVFKLGLLMLCRLYKLLILCMFVTHTFLHICREYQALCCCISFFPTSGWLLVTMTNQGRWLSIECCFDIRSGDILHQWRNSCCTFVQA